MPCGSPSPCSALLQFSEATVSGAPANAVCIEVKLKEAVAPSQVATLDSVTVLANAQVPYPAQISQGETQLMLFNGNVYVSSPYSISTQTTEVRIVHMQPQCSSAPHTLTLTLTQAKMQICRTLAQCHGLS